MEPDAIFAALEKMAAHHAKAPVQPASTAEFRCWLIDLGLSQSALARLLTEYGDPAAPSTILRRVQRWATGEARVPGEAIAFLNLWARASISAAAIRAPATQDKEKP